LHIPIAFLVLLFGFVAALLGVVESIMGRTAVGEAQS
jgi:hypothetical protein